MDDMTPERALEIHMKRLEDDIQSARSRGDDREADFEQAILDHVKTALSRHEAIEQRAADIWIVYDATPGASRGAYKHKKTGMLFIFEDELDAKEVARKLPLSSYRKATFVEIEGRDD